MFKLTLGGFALLAMTTSGCFTWEAPHRTPVRGSANLIVVETGRPGQVFLIDRARRRCFLQRGRRVRAIPCRLIRAARLEFGWDRPHMRPGFRRPIPRPTTRRPDLRPRTTPPSRPATKPKVTNPRRPDPKRFRLGAKPTPTELSRFREAYKAVYCARRQGAVTSPARIIAQFGITVSRYGQLEAWLSRNRAAWEALSRETRAACPK